MLKLRHDATPAQIRTAYKNLSRLHHPDMNPGNPKATEAMAKINASYDVLSNPEARKEYDALLAQQREAAQKPAPGSARPASSPHGAAPPDAQVFTAHFPDPSPGPEPPKRAPRKAKRRAVDPEAEQRAENRAFLVLMARRALFAAVVIAWIIYSWRLEHDREARIRQETGRFRDVLHGGQQW